MGFNSGFKGLNQGVELFAVIFILTYSMKKSLSREANQFLLHGTHQLWVYADDVGILGGSISTIKKVREAFVVACKENGLEVNADKTKYMVMSRDQNTRRSHNTNTDNNSFESVEEFKYL